MKYTLVFLFTYIIFKQATGQPCAFYNSAEAPNYCCGHDPELKSQNVNQRLLDNQQGQENFCNTNHYILEDKSNASSLGGDWFLVWNDEFNYGLVDWSAYDTVIAGTNILPEGDGNVEQIYRGKNVSVTNGKLVYTAFNHSSPIEKFYYIDPADYTTKYKHFDYSTDNTQTKIHFPLNAYHQTNIRCAPNPNKLWSAYWLYGGGPAAQEIDMFEVTGGGVLGNGGSGAYSGSPDDPATSLKMTYHYRKDANQFSTDSKAEGIHHKTNFLLTQNLNYVTSILLNKLNLISDNKSKFLAKNNIYTNLNNVFRNDSILKHNQNEISVYVSLKYFNSHLLKIKINPSPNFSIQYARFLTKKEKCNFGLTIGSTFTRYDINMPNIFKELSQEETNDFIKGEGLERTNRILTYQSINLGVLERFIYKKISIDFFISNEFAFIIHKSNGSYFFNSKANNCSPTPGLPNHCNSRSNRFSYDNYYFSEDIGWSFGYKLNHKSSIGLSYSTNLLYSFISSGDYYFVRRGISLKDVYDNGWNNYSINFYGGIQLYFHPGYIRNQNLSLTYKIQF
ncbi:MAG: hypothetical protein IM600_10185 [Bacteroidetes bacterium]|nr:hypothetical protein [Bacteroidota bacterium]MCA6443784.1 hypothetical protein [Bacteroidota bacterium]